MSIIAIDPGTTGAYAVLGDAGELLEVDDLPVTGKTIDASAFAQMVAVYEPAFVIVENVASMPKQGIASTWKFAVAVGVIHGVIGALEVPMALVTAREWKKHFKLAGKDKDKARLMAQRRFPACRSLARKKDHNRADALLMALWYHETWQPTLSRPRVDLPLGDNDEHDGEYDAEHD